MCHEGTLTRSGIDIVEEKSRDRKVLGRDITTVNEIFTNHSISRDATETQLGIGSRVFQPGNGRNGSVRRRQEHIVEGINDD